MVNSMHANQTFFGKHMSKSKAEVKSLFVSDIEQQKKIVKEFVMDQTQPWEDRYEVWKGCPNHLVTHQSWVIRPSDFEKQYGELCWYDDFYKERYETVDCRELDYYRYFDHNPEKWKAFATDCMNNGYFTFQNDW